MWVRGLKQTSWQKTEGKPASHPMWVRGLKRVGDVAYKRFSASHPMWVRGLKHNNKRYYRPLLSRTLCGCVD